MNKRQFQKTLSPADYMPSPTGPSLGNADNGACAKAYGDTAKTRPSSRLETALKDGNQAVPWRDSGMTELLNGNPWSTVPRPVEG